MNYKNYYKFDDTNNRIIINRHDLPSPWINYLSNGKMHAFVSQAGGGFAWWDNPLNYRLTRYRMHNMPIDSPGFYVYIRLKDGTIWSPTFRPCNKKLDSWTAIHQPGKSVFTARKGKIEAELTLYVAMDHDTLVWDLKLTNDDSESVEFDVFAYVELSQLVWKDEIFSGYYWRHMLKVWFEKDIDSLVYLYHSQYHPNIKNVPLVYFASTDTMVSYSGSRDDFMGPYRDEKNPQGVENCNCGNNDLSCGEPCAALQNSVSIDAHGTKKIGFFLGVIPGALLDFSKVKEQLAEELNLLRLPGTMDEQSKKTDEWWGEHLQVYDCSIPDKDAERQINLWSPVNTVHTARYSRAINTNAPGVRGFGFRDTCQDMIAMAYRKPQWSEKMLGFLLRRQFVEGHTVHTIPSSEKELPDPSLHSDNHLWLPFLAYAIAVETGDYSFLEKKVPYLKEDLISATEDVSVWEHLLSAIRLTEAHLGMHKLPLTLKGDWNDIIGKFSQRGFGESVFAGQQYVVTLKFLIEMAEAIDDFKNSEWLKGCKRRQEQALTNCAWDGKWWLRGFDDDGNPVGIEQSKYGKLFLNPQSWAVLSSVGTTEQLQSAMDCVNENLDTGIGLKAIMPGFDTWPEVSDPFTGYGPGCGENGAIFCHANTWAIIAETHLGNGTRAWKYFKQLIPHVALQKVGIETYQAEPYAWVSNIVGPENSRFGWANVSHVTGTAAWMDIVATQYLLGLRPEIKGLRIDPCIPNNWQSFSISRLYRGCMLNIDVKNPDGVEKGVKSIIIDGNSVILEQLPYITEKMLQGKSMAAVQVIMG